MGALGGWDPVLTPDMRDRARMGSPEPLREAEGKSWREEGKRCSCGARIASTGHIFLQGRTFPARTSKAQSCNEGRPAGQQCNAQRVGGQSFHKNLILPFHPPTWKFKPLLGAEFRHKRSLSLLKTTWGTHLSTSP